MDFYSPEELLLTTTATIYCTGNDYQPEVYEEGIYDLADDIDVYGEEEHDCVDQQHLHTAPIVNNTTQSMLEEQPIMENIYDDTPAETDEVYLDLILF